MANASATTQSRGCGDFFNRRQKPATGGLSFRRSVSARHGEARTAISGARSLVSANPFLAPTRVASPSIKPTGQASHIDATTPQERRGDE